ncbi:hypothetical protein DEO72_LG4g506 [Vigna unguiculata]|uniref:Uncharacterized protein n=1 Tax=Vigna unguiculata TaxID=3917 RepID=A0A4D6LLZ7_VIGUN|nr:hypothetical protein DEO72_LG4g506 [Vigna unguiculata]
MNQISITTRLALSEFQAFCYPHHRSQSALGWRVSLRRDSLAQARQSRSGEFPLRLSEGTKQEHEQRGTSLRRDPSRLGELSARSKIKELVAWATLGEKGLGKPPPDSLRRVRLA